MSPRVKLQAPGSLHKQMGLTVDDIYDEVLDRGPLLAPAAAARFLGA